MKKPIILFIFLFFSFSALANGPTMHWLEGNWSGTGGDINSTFNWTITLSYKADESTIKLAYPSHSCGGTLKIITIETGKANCIENVTYGLGGCSTGLKVTIDQESDGSITLMYYYTENSVAKSTAKLTRK